MTQKEKLKEAFMLAQRVKSIAKSIDYEAKDYDTRWPLKYSEELTRVADAFLKLIG